MFLEKKQPKKNNVPSLHSLSPVMSLQALQEMPKVQSLLARLKTLYSNQSIEQAGWYEALLNHLLRYMESLPDSAHRYYAEKGGLLEHALFRTELAVSRLQQMMWVENKQLTDEQSCWQYAMFSAALLYGIGKLYLDYQVDLFDGSGKSLGRWNPFAEDLISRAAFYGVEVNFEPQGSFRSQLNSVLAQQLMPPKSLEWLSSMPAVFERWLALLNEDLYRAEPLGAILEYADTQMWSALLDAWLEKNMLSKARLRTFEQAPIDSSVLVGLTFLHWLKQQLASGVFSLNQKPLQMTADGLLLGKEVFQAFARSHASYKNWEAVQRGFLSLGFNDKSVNTAEVLFSRFGIVLPSKVQLHNPFTKESTSVPAIEALYFGLKGAKWLPTESTAAVSALPKLNAKGVWHYPDASGVLLQPGQSYRG